MKSQIKSLENLFVSKVRLKVLKYFLLNPNRSIHLRGAVRLFDEEINAVRRELIRLEEINVLIVESKGNRKYFKLNIDHIFISELLGIFHKSFGLGGSIIKDSKKLGEISFALLTSAFTKGIHRFEQRIDLFIVGEIDMSSLAKIVAEHESKLGLEIHYMVLKPNEFRLRKRRNDPFVMDILLNEFVLLIGDKDQLVAIDNL